MDDRRRDGGTNSTLRIKEQGTHLNLNEHVDDDDDVNCFHDRPPIPTPCPRLSDNFISEWSSLRAECLFVQSYKRTGQFAVYRKRVEIAL